MKKNLVSMSSPMFGTLTTKEMKNVFGGETSTNATNGVYMDPRTKIETKCKDREVTTWHKDKNGQVIEDNVGCTEYFINGAWV